MKAYKLTDQNGKTKNNTQWGPNITHSSTGNDKSLCSNGWIHFYKDPLIAVLMNPSHADFKSPKLWECETDGEHLHEELKSGCKTLTTIKEIPVPEISLTQKIAFGILCVKEIFNDEKWNLWADKWLSGEDRSERSANIAAYAAAVYAADAAAYAADAAAYAAVAAVTAAYTADAVHVAVDAAYHNIKINFIELANKALTYK